MNLNKNEINLIHGFIKWWSNIKFGSLSNMASEFSICSEYYHTDTAVIKAYGRKDPYALFEIGHFLLENDPYRLEKEFNKLLEMKYDHLKGRTICIHGNELEFQPSIDVIVFIILVDYFKIKTRKDYLRTIIILDFYWYTINEILLDEFKKKACQRRF